MVRPLLLLALTTDSSTSSAGNVRPFSNFFLYLFLNWLWHITLNSSLTTIHLFFSRSPDRLDTGGSNSSSLYDAAGEFKSGYNNVGSVTAAGPDVKRVEAAKTEAEVEI